jgi:hypothetical protein
MTTNQNPNHPQNLIVFYLEPLNRTLYSLYNEEASLMHLTIIRAHFMLIFLIAALISLLNCGLEFNIVTMIYVK